MSFEHFLARRIFEPLGMADTFFHVPEDKRDRVPDAWVLHPERGTILYDPGGGESRWATPLLLFGGGGGLAGTTADYHRFCRMLLGGGELDGVRLLAPRTIELMTRNHLPGGADLETFGRPLSDVSRAGYGFGLGFSVLVDPVRAKSLGSHGEYGWGGAAGTEFWVDPTEELIAVFFTQLLPAIGPLRQQLRQMIYQALID
jgi:CubicO group peptidase (beta-lactamase class C family)